MSEAWEAPFHYEPEPDEVENGEAPQAPPTQTEAAPLDQEAIALQRVEAQQRKRLIENAMNNRYVYNEPAMEWFDIEKLLGYPEKAFNRLSDAVRLQKAYQDVLDCAPQPTDKKAQPPKAPPASTILLPIIRRVDNTVMLYGEPRVVEYECSGATRQCLNLYCPSKIKPVAARQSDADVAPYLDHIRAICRSDPQAAAHMFDWMAWVVQNPTLKIRWAPLIYSQQGIGKDTLLRPLIEIIGVHNCIDISPSDLEGGFNAYDAAKLVTLNEMHNSSRYTTYDKLKPKISGTGSGHVTVNPKYERPYLVRNVSAWVVFTNHSDAMPMEMDDRRFYVINGTQPCSKDGRQSYFDHLHDWMGNGGTSRLFRWLLDRDVKAFNANQPPADTKAKHDMTWEAMTPVAQHIASQCEVGCWAKRTIITAKEVERHARQYHLDASARKLSDGLRAAGFANIGVHPMQGGSAGVGAKTTWYARGGIEWSPNLREVMLAEMPSDVRAMMFGVTTSSLPQTNVSQFPRSQP